MLINILTTLIYRDLLINLLMIIFVNYSMVDDGIEFVLDFHVSLYALFMSQYEPCSFNCPLCWWHLKHVYLKVLTWCRSPESYWPLVFLLFIGLIPRFIGSSAKWWRHMGVCCTFDSMCIPNRSNMLILLLFHYLNWRVSWIRWLLACYI